MMERTAGWKMKPTAVGSGVAAMRALEDAHNQGKPFSLILTDYMMPEIDGFELVERMAYHYGISAKTIIMLTSAGERGDAARCIKLGVAAYLHKPVRQSELLFAIIKTLQVHSVVADARILITRHSIIFPVLTAMQRSNQFYL